MKSLKAIFLFPLLCLGTSLIFIGCKDDTLLPPEVEFKTNVGYTYSDASVSQGDSLLVGIIATRTEGDLTTYNVSYAYDGTTSTTTSQNFTIQFTSPTYEKDVTIVIRNQAGSERWIFTVTDRDGNFTSKELRFTAN